MQHAVVVSVAIALVLLLACSPQRARADTVPAKCAGVTDIVIGQSADNTQIDLGAAEGLRAAIAEAARLTKLPLRVVRYNHTTEEELMANVKRLVEEDCAFMIAATTATSVTQPSLLAYLKSYNVPFVGSLSSSQDLRSVANLTALFTRSTSTSAVTLPFVVNVRPSASDELNAVLSILSHDWASLSQVALVVHNTPYGEWAYQYVDKSLRVLTGSTGLLSKFFFGTDPMTDEQVGSAMATLLKPTAPKTIIMGTIPSTTAQLVTWLAHSSYSDLSLYMLVSWMSGTDLYTSLDAQTKALLDSKNIRIHITQNMPDPAPASLKGAIPLIRRFDQSQSSYRSHSALEGYLVGWFIYEVAQHAAARYGLPLTHGDFLYTVFEDMRTFNVQGVTLGPYGDGGLGSSSSTQSASDACNQGVHDMYITTFEPSNGSQVQMAGAAFKFAGCIAPQWSAGGTVTLVGSVDNPDSTEDANMRSGLLGAVNDHNSDGANTVLLRSMEGSADAIKKYLAASGVVAVATPRLIQESSVDIFDGVALVSPMPGFWGLRRPFQRDIINLFPSAYDEAVAAFVFLRSMNVTRVAVLVNDNSTYTRQCVEGLEHADKHDMKVESSANYVGASAWVCEHAKEFDAFFVLGGTFDSSACPEYAALRLLNSQVVIKEVDDDNATAGFTYSLSVSPPLIAFASTSDLRTEYATWVSSADQDDTSFQSFFVGKFLSQAIDIAKGSNPNRSLSADSIVDAVYKRSVFTIGEVQVGPFKDAGSSRESCNQGLDTVYVLAGTTGQRIYATISVGDCGRDYLPPLEQSSDDKFKLITGLAAGLGGVEFFNIHKTEIELGKCLGHGRFGAMYMADWHGTAVAVRVIDKKATPKEDQRLIKEEVLLLHKHHHPNLLMLMGYCETRTELLVVTEYMEGGTLADYLRREKRYVDVYSLVAMAFDVLKGIAYLHACKPPIVHGSICTHNLLLDAKGTVKVSDFWFSNKRGAFSSSGSGRSLKKAAWQPPEVIAGTFLTPGTDVYAFGIVLWELIAPLEMTQSSSASASCTGSESQSSAHSLTPSATPVISSGMLSMGVGGVVEMHQAQLGPPEIPPNASAEVCDLFTRCWQSQPERRPSVFQILRNWPSTFASLGAFEVPQDLIASVGSGNVQGLFSQHSSGSGGAGANTKVKHDDSSDEMASMMSIMPLKMDSVALQVPQEPEATTGLSAVNQHAAEEPEKRLSV
eukprot:m51a1_g8843 putative pas domain-containing protein tyrosine kinase (1217) ;mRNA; r:450006-454500